MINNYLFNSMVAKKILFTIIFFLFGWNVFAQNMDWLKAKTTFGNTTTRQINVDQSGHIFTILFKPCKELTSDWDSFNSVWYYHDSVRNTYNSDGNITQKLQYMGGSTINYKNIYVYNGNGKITSDTGLYFDGNSFVNNTLLTYTYDINGNKTQQISFNGWDGSAWTSGNKSDYTYDVNNNQIQNLEQSWNGITWVANYKQIFTWSNGFVITALSQLWDGNVWIDNWKTDYTYVSGQLNSLTSSQWTGTSWQNISKLNDIVWYQWSGFFNESSKLSSFIEQVSNGSLWKDTTISNWTYDMFGNQTEYLRQAKPSSVYITVEGFKNFYQYNGNNSITEDVQQNWNQGTQLYEIYKKREYSDFYEYTVVSCVPDQPDIILGNTSVTAGTTETYSVDSVIGATSYNWTLPSGWTGSSTTNSISVTVGASSGLITVSAVNGCGVSSPSVLTVTQGSSLPNNQDWVWAESSGGQYGGYAMDIATDATGNAYAIGLFTAATITFDTITLNKVSTGSNTDVFLVKFDSIGNALWAKNTSIGYLNSMSGYAVATDDNNNVLITGAFSSISTFDGVTLTHTGISGSQDIFIVKYNNQGNLIWAKEIDYTGSIWMGDIATDSQGSVVITGSFSPWTPISFGSTTLSGHCNTGPFLAKFDSAGNAIWAKGAEPTTNFANWSYGVATDANDNFYITGEYVSDSSNPFTFGSLTLPSTNNYGRSMYIVKYDNIGNTLWGKASTSPPSSGSYNAVGYNITTDFNGNVIVIGSFQSTTLNFGSIVLSNSNTNQTPDIFLVKYDSFGNELWVKKAGGLGYDEGHKICSDNFGNIYVTGYFESKPASFGSFTINKQTNGEPLFFVVKYDYFGNEIWAKYSEKTSGHSGNLRTNGVSADDFGNVYVTGDALNSNQYGSAIFGNTTLTNGGIFIAKLGETPIGIKENKNILGLIFYPNPANDFITIENTSTLLNSMYLIFNSLGQQVLTGKLIAKTTTVDITKLSTGLYFLQVGEVEKQTFKLMKK